MVTLHIGKLLEDEGFGILAVTGSEPNADIFWEEIPLGSDGKGKEGIWIIPRGFPLTRFTVTVQAFDIYSRYANKITGSKKLQDILLFLQRAYEEVCELPLVPPYSTTQYDNVRLIPVSGIENVGSDDQDRIVRVISAEVQFNIVEES